jgi:hypothetical protein
MSVICQCPNCLGDVVGRFQRSCVVCGTDIPVELRMAHVLEPERHERALKRGERVAAQDGSLTLVMEREADALDVHVFDVLLDQAGQDQPRDMDWEDDKPTEGSRRRRWFRRANS